MDNKEVILIADRAQFSVLPAIIPASKFRPALLAIQNLGQLQAYSIPTSGTNAFLTVHR